MYPLFEYEVNNNNLISKPRERKNDEISFKEKINFKHQITKDDSDNEELNPNEVRFRK